MPAAQPRLPASIRKAVDAWIANGCTVEIAPDLSIKVTPPNQKTALDPYELRELK